MGWDTEEVTAKNAEVQQSRDSLSDFIDKTQAELQALAERLKVSMLHMSSCGFAFWYAEEADRSCSMSALFHAYIQYYYPCWYDWCLCTYKYQGRWCNVTIALISDYSIWLQSAQSTHTVCLCHSVNAHWHRRWTETEVQWWEYLKIYYMQRLAQTMGEIHVYEWTILAFCCQKWSTNH